MFEFGSLSASRRPGADPATVRYCFTDRHGGVGVGTYRSLNLSGEVGDDPAAVAANRSTVLRRAGLSSAVWLHATHGRDVAVVDERDGRPADDLSRGPDCDALATACAGLGLAAMSADCALVVLADPATGVVAVTHCGRPGLLAGVVDSAVAAMRDEGADEIVAAVGPTICGDCYELPHAMAAEIVAAVPAAAHGRCESRATTGHVDIRAGVVSQLLEHGIPSIEVGGCPREDPDLFSYRRDLITGRLAALVWRVA